MRKGWRIGREKLVYQAILREEMNEFGNENAKRHGESIMRKVRSTWWRRLSSACSPRRVHEAGDDTGRMVEYRLWSPDGTQGKWKTLHLPVVGLITDQLNAPRSWHSISAIVSPCSATVCTKPTRMLTHSKTICLTLWLTPA